MADKPSELPLELPHLPPPLVQCLINGYEFLHIPVDYTFAIERDLSMSEIQVKAIVRMYTLKENIYDVVQHVPDIWLSHRPPVDTFARIGEWLAQALRGLIIEEVFMMKYGQWLAEQVGLYDGFGHEGNKLDSRGAAEVAERLLGGLDRRLERYERGKARSGEAVRREGQDDAAPVLGEGD